MMPCSGVIVKVSGRNSATDMPDDSPGMMPANVPISVPRIIINSPCHCTALMKPCCMWINVSISFPSTDAENAGREAGIQDVLEDGVCRRHHSDCDQQAPQGRTKTKDRLSAEHQHDKGSQHAKVVERS